MTVFVVFFTSSYLCLGYIRTRERILLSHGVTVTPQVLVLLFPVRIRVAQQGAIPTLFIWSGFEIIRSTEATEGTSFDILRLSEWK